MNPRKYRAVRPVGWIQARVPFPEPFQPTRAIKLSRVCSQTGNRTMNSKNPIGTTCTGCKFAASGSGCPNWIWLWTIHRQIGVNITSHNTVPRPSQGNSRLEGGPIHHRRKLRTKNSGTAKAREVIFVMVASATRMPAYNKCRKRFDSNHRTHQYAAQAAVHATRMSWVT